MHYAEYARYDAIGLANLVRRGDVSASELTEAALSRMDAVNSSLNAVIYRYDERARATAVGGLPEGLFQGVPFLLKDMPDGALAGTPLTMGSRSMSGQIADHDSELVERYRRSGVVFVGTTNTPELGLMGTTEPKFTGPTRNPWNLAYSSGGSSGGAASAVAAGIVPVAHGNDGGGSIRIPASACGLFGLKPTRGRVPLGPDSSDGWNGFVASHVISRSVRDSAAFLDLTHGADVGAPYVAPAPTRPFSEEVGTPPGKLKIAWVRRSLLGDATHPDCGAACEEAAALLRSLGHEVIEANLPISAEEIRMAYLTIVAACTAADIVVISKVTGKPISAEEFEASTWFMGQIGRAFSAADLELARLAMGRASRAMGGFFGVHDIIMTPTMAYPPIRIGELDLKPIERAGLAVLRRIGPKSLLRRALVELAADFIEKTPNTMLFNMTGQPAMSVPLYWSTAGLPIGIQFAARFGDEGTLIRLAAQLEEATPWAEKRPNV